MYLMENVTHQKKGDSLGSYVCTKCDTIFPIDRSKTHCGRPMEVKMLDNTLSWVCWKGVHAPCCGKASHLEFDQCCSDPHLHLQTP